MPRTTQIFCASTLYGAATLAAALDAGLFAPADRRLLLITNNATNPEITPSVDAMPGFSPISERFDEVRSWNATISPFHPSGWSPRADDIPGDVMANGKPNASWGLHLIDVHAAIGDLVDLVGKQAKAYLVKAGGF